MLRRERAVRRSWQHWLRVCVVAMTVPMLTMGPAWAGRGFFRCHRQRCRPACCRPVTCCPGPCETECDGCEPVACCEAAPVADTATVIVEDAKPSAAQTPAAPDSVVAQPTRPDTSSVAEAVPTLAPAAPVAAASAETPAPPAPAPELEAELAELKSELSDLKTDMKSDLEAGLSRLKSEMKTEMSQLKSELKSDLKSGLSELKMGMKSDLEAELEALKTKLESQPKPEPAAAQQPARPAEDNIFEEGKGGSSYEDFRDAEDAQKPAMKESPQPEAEPATSASEPSAKPAADADPSQPTVKPAEPDSPFPLPEIPAPAIEEPAVPAPATPAPAGNTNGVPAPEIDDPFSALPPEPVRRWFDDSGSHDTVGQLVEVHPDRVRIRKLNGRFTTVAISRLSAADQSYVTATGERLAAKPRLTDTAAK